MHLTDEKLTTLAIKNNGFCWSRLFTSAYGTKVLARRAYRPRRRRRYTNRKRWEDVVSSEPELPKCTNSFSNRLVSFHFCFYFYCEYLYFRLLMVFFVTVSFNRNSGSWTLAAATWYPESSVTPKLISFAGAPAAAPRCTEVFGYA